MTLLYEDSAGERAEFGLHDLVVCCVADRLGCEPWALKDRLRGYPKNGNSKVWTACRQELPRLTRTGHVVVAVFDNDRVRSMAKLALDACKVRVTEAIKRGCDPASLLRVVLIEQNTESVLVGLRSLGAVQGREEAFALAIERKDVASRDILFKLAARRLTAEQRASLLAAVPSLGYLVGKVVAMLREPPAPDPG
ncbi:MAG: hypothetical protein U0324_11585 [Polyangiales bacterium]